jgi:hypothetical protein
MRAKQTALAVLAGVLALAADDPGAVKSGPQVGARIIAPFEVRLCNGAEAGDMACLV